jgi:hypothetical protein
MTLPGLDLDAVTITFSDEIVDNDTGMVRQDTAVTLWTGRATIGSASAAERQYAAQRGEVLEETMAITNAAPLRVGATVTGRGKTWTVIDVKDVRTHQRASLRRVSG